MKETMKETIKSARNLLLAALLPALSLAPAACGFHLRGAQPGGQAEARSVYLHGADAERVRQALRERLGAAVAARRGEAEYQISVSGESIRQNVLSVSAVTGKVEEFKVNYSCRLSIEKIGAETALVDNQRLSFSRDYTFDEDAALSKFEERRLIEDELINEAAQAIARRFNAVAGR